MITDYIILRESDITALRKDVKDLLNRGWKPLGGVAMMQLMAINLHTTYAQAMIKEEK